MRAIEFLVRAKGDQDRSSFGIVMTVLTKIFYCSNVENELKSFSQQEKLSKFCIGAGLLNVVEIGTVLHDEKHCRILTVHKCSALS